MFYNNKLYIDHNEIDHRNKVLFTVITQKKENIFIVMLMILNYISQQDHMKLLNYLS